VSAPFCSQAAFRHTSAHSEIRIPHLNALGCLPCPALARYKQGVRNKWRWPLRAAIVLVAVYSGSALCLVASGRQPELGHADLGVVLGATVHPNGQPSTALRARLDEALLLYRQGYFPLVMVSGGLGREGHQEAEVMKAYLTARGVPEAAIVVDNDGNDTYLTARHTAQLLHARKLRSVLVISQYFHLPRCRLALARFGVPTIYSGPANRIEGRDLYSIAREVFGYPVYLLRPYPKA